MNHDILLNTAKNNWSYEDKTMILAFLEYIFKILQIRSPVKLILDQQYEEGDISIKINLRLAYVIPQDRLIVIYCKDRGLLDVLRSIAHELIHIEQLDNNRLVAGDIPFYLKDENTLGYDNEYEAYGKSGILVRNFRAILNEE
jgi:hypothetical protein